MSVYKPRGKPYYHYDFQLGGVRFHGSTGKEERRAAEAVERSARQKAAKEREHADHLGAAFRGEAPLTLDAAVGRWWLEVGQGLTASETQWRNCEAMIAYFGASTTLAEITDEWVARWVTERAGALAWGRLKAKTGTVKRVAPATVNRTTVDMLRKIFTRARRTWKLSVPNEPDWREHRLEEGRPTINLLTPAAETALHVDLGEGYRDIWRFALVSGLRLAECFLTWPQVVLPDEAAGRPGFITVTQKGGRPHIVPISREMLAIIVPQIGLHPTHVFTAPRLRRSDGSQRLGERFPLTYNGVKTRFRRVKRARADVVGPVRFHDMRHNRAFTLLNKTGDLTKVKQLLGHARLSTTADYYMHLEIESLRQALDAEAPSRERRAKSRPNSRPRGKKTG